MKPRSFKSPPFLATLLVAALGLVAVPHVALAADEAGSKSEAAQLAMEQLRERLALTPDQEARIAPLVQARNQKLQALRGSMDADASRRQKRGALKEAREIQSEFVEKVEPILTPQQKKEWEALRKEMRDEMMTRYRNR
jgi:Spy/CpxP family protein refolding chaperone